MASKNGSASSSVVVRVLSVPDQSPIIIRFLGPLLGLDTHRKGGQPVPCQGPGECPIGTHRLPLIWKGYAPSHQWDVSARVWTPVVLEATEALEEALRGRELRGEVWSLSRDPEHPKPSPVVAVFCESVDPSILPEAFPILPVLQRLYHCAELRLGTRNQLPAKLRLESVAGPAPNLPAELQPGPSKCNSPEEVEAARKAWEKFRAAGYRGTVPDASKTAQPGSNGHTGSNGVR